MSTLGPSVSPTSDGNDVIDSYYQWVKQRILALNAQRNFAGVIQAADWPWKQAKEQTYHLAINIEQPGTVGRHPSPSSPLYTIRLAWVYLIEGSDIQPGQQAPNRSKYRINNAMKQELIHGTYPQFCERQQWTLDEANELQAQSYYPLETIWWNQITFRDKIDKRTGILFGEASVLLTSFSPTILS